MSISFSGSTLTFSDSTTMTTASVAGPPGSTGPTGPTGSAGPTGPTGTVSTCYGAVGTSLPAFYPHSGRCFVIRPCTTVSGACLYRASDTSWSSISGSNGAGFNATFPCAKLRTYVCSSNRTSLSLSGTWRSQTHGVNYYCAAYAYLHFWTRVS